MDVGDGILGLFRFENHFQRKVCHSTCAQIQQITPPLERCASRSSGNLHSDLTEKCRLP